MKAGAHESGSKLHAVHTLRDMVRSRLRLAAIRFNTGLEAHGAAGVGADAALGGGDKIEENFGREAGEARARAGDGVLNIESRTEQVVVEFF